jgi:hypothetical protein
VGPRGRHPGHRHPPGGGRAHPCLRASHVVAPCAGSTGPARRTVRCGRYPASGHREERRPCFATRSSPSRRSSRTAR